MDEMLEMSESRFFAKYRGAVVDNEDPTGRGRLKVRVRAVMGEEEVWAMPCVPYAGAGVGLFALPEVGTGVWVEFESGDPSYPIWVGCFWADNDIPSGDAVPSIKFLRTEKVTLRIDDSVGELVIENDSGSVFRLTPQEISQESNQIKNKAGGKETALTPAQFDVANGTFRVI